MTIPVIYEASVDGAEKAGNDLSSIVERAERGAKSAGSTFKSIARDIDVIGGKSSAEFGKVASDLFGIGEAALSGPVPALIALATVVGGAVVNAWNEEEEAIKRNKKANEDADKAIRELAKGIEEKRKAITMDTVMLRENEIALRKQALLQKEVLLDAVIANKEAGHEFIENAKKQRELEAQIAKERSQIELDERRNVAAKDKLLTREANEARAAQSQENANKIIKAEKDKADALKRIREESEDAYDKIIVEMHEKAMKDGEERRKQAMKEAEEQAKMMEAQRKAVEESTEAQQRAIDADRERTRAIREKTNAMVMEQKQMALNSSANIAYAVTMTALTPVINEVGEAVGTLTMLNQENYREILFQGRETPKLIAQKTQAILSGIAKEAATRALFEGADTLKEEALAVGSLAILDFGGAALHANSAAVHSASAAAFSGLAAAAGGGAVAVGFARTGGAGGKGLGGMFGLTKDEQEQRNRGGGTVDMQRGGDGTWRSTGEGGGGGGKSVIYINYGAGAIAPSPDDTRRAARAVAGYVRQARNSWFLREGMGG